MVGTAAELASLRHWDGFEQLIPWIALAVLGVAFALELLSPLPRAVALLAVDCRLEEFGPRTLRRSSANTSSRGPYEHER